MSDFIHSKSRSWGYWIQKDFPILEGWRKPDKDSTAQVIDKKTKKTVELNNYSLTHIDSSVSEENVSLLEENVEEITSDDLNSLVNAAIHQVVKPLLPKCVFWEYKESNLLPPKISIETFKDDPDSCLPMKYMFALAGYSSVKSSIEDAQKRPKGLRNLLKRVSDKSTEHLHKVWRDYKNIRLQLIQNGDNIDAQVEDTYNAFDFSSRSDGFKRFITFLLLVSAKAEINELENTLYLHDEPDISLHPSGARYLRDELIKISKKNLVLYSTHSIFMIDRNIINRHLIVEKKNEVTDVREVNVSNFVDEEVIYNAIGYSTFENLKAKNIIFEGWRDKKLFEFAIEHLPQTRRKLKKTLSEIGFCFAKGVKDIGRITPMLELAGREYLIVSDSDKPAIEQQQKYEGDGLWMRYDELLSDKSLVTAEDFIKPLAFNSAIQKIKNENSSLPDFPIEDLKNPFGRLFVIQKWLESNHISKENTKTILDELKTSLISNLKPSHLEPKYFDLLDEIAKQF
ncbi:MAG: ATP-binding protein [Acidobacteria bacterium]|nr:ATP-binding protein [Acidobacteriota bacterium]